MTRWTPLILCLLVALPAAAQENGRAWPSQQPGAPTGPEDPPLGKGGNCRYLGERFTQGDTTCIDRHGNSEEALCGMSHNVTSWLWQGQSCRS